MALYRETAEVAKGAMRLIRAVGNRIAVDDPDDLVCLVEIIDEAEAALQSAVAGLRVSGFTDAQIGRALGGVTKQAVQQGFPR